MATHSRCRWKSYASKQAPCCTSTRHYNILNSRTASLNEKKNSAVNWKTQSDVHKPKQNTPQCSAMFCCQKLVFRYLHSVPLPAEIPSLPLHFVFACIHLQHGNPSDSSVTIINSTAFLYTLYAGMASSTSSNCLDSFINILIRFACIKADTFLVRSKHLIL
jgi:hypothetical protein